MTKKLPETHLKIRQWIIINTCQTQKLNHANDGIISNRQGWGLNRYGSQLTSAPLKAIIGMRAVNLQSNETSAVYRIRIILTTFILLINSWRNFLDDQQLFISIMKKDIRKKNLYIKYQLSSGLYGYSGLLLALWQWHATKQITWHTDRRPWQY